MSLVTAAQAATPAACPPYTFVGRITDAKHVAYDDEEQAVLTAAAADGTLLASSSSFHRDGSPNNYVLIIPMANSAADHCALQGDTVSVTAKADGRTWQGVIDPAVIGTPGTVSHVDIVLAEDADGDGIDDALFQGLKVSSAYADEPDSAYDPRTVDSDGDGMCDLDEAHLGTDPFSADDVLSIVAFTPSPASVTFPTRGGHAYAVEASSSLSSSDWTPVSFSTTSENTAAKRSLLSIPSSARAADATLYLFPTSSPVFFRIAPQ